MKNIQIFYLTLWSQMYSLTAGSVICGNWSFHQVSSNNDYISTTEVFDNIPTSNVASCVNACLSQDECASFIFNSNSCYTYSVFLDLNPAGESSPGALYYQFTVVDECIEGLHNCPSPSHACQDTLRSYTCVCAAGFTGDGITCTPVSLNSITCNNNDDCPTPHSRCRGSVCECQLGYHYSPGDETCVEACSAYGTDFTRQVTGHCFGAAAGGRNMGERSLSSCKTECINDGTGTCRVVQISDDSCTLFHTTYLENQSQWGTFEECSYHQRDCAQ